MEQKAPVTDNPVGRVNKKKKQGKSDVGKPTTRTSGIEKCCKLVASLIS